VVPGAGEPDYLQLGTKFTFDVHMDLWSPPGSSGRATALQVSVLEGVDEEDGRKGWRVAWRFVTHSLDGGKRPTKQC